MASDRAAVYLFARMQGFDLAAFETYLKHSSWNRSTKSKANRDRLFGQVKKMAGLLASGNQEAATAWLHVLANARSFYMMLDVLVPEVARTQQRDRRRKLPTDGELWPAFDQVVARRGEPAAKAWLCRTYHCSPQAVNARLRKRKESGR